MNSSLGFTEIEESPLNINKEESKSEASKRKRNITYKKRETNKAKKFLNSMQKVFLPDPSKDDEENELGELWQSSDMANTTAETPASVSDEDEFTMLREGMEQQQKYYQRNNQEMNKYTPAYERVKNVPYYTNLADSQEITGPKDALMKKLNYVVHMLEEQQDQKTGSVTEEMVLYMFLGVFVIFVVDSFSKTGRYRRG